jgi:hypothetical protein
MKLKWENIILTFGLVMTPIAWMWTIHDASCKEIPKTGPLEPGELVRHRLLEDLRGVVLWNPEGKTIAVRWEERLASGTVHRGIWEHTIDAEWERE